MRILYPQLEAIIICKSRKINSIALFYPQKRKLIYCNITRKCNFFVPTGKAFWGTAPYRTVPLSLCPEHLGYLDQASPQGVALRRVLGGIYLHDLVTALHQNRIPVSKYLHKSGPPLMTLTWWEGFTGGMLGVVRMRGRVHSNEYFAVLMFLYCVQYGF